MLSRSSRASSTTSSSPTSAHIVTTPDDDDTATVAPSSSPPSSSPAAITPPENLEEGAVDRGTASASESPFLCRLDDLLLAAQEDPRARGSNLFPGYSEDWTGPTGSGRTAAHEATSTLILQCDFSRKRTVSGTICSTSDDVQGSAQKKRKLSNAPSRLPTRASRSKTSASTTRLSGAFRLQYARGPGSLRRAESLRSQVSLEEEEQVLNEVIDKSIQDTSGLLNALVPRDLPIVVGNVASPFGGYAPTVPTTPTANDTGGKATTAHEGQPLISDIPVIPVPPFELIPKPPQSAEEAAERRIQALLSRERDQMHFDGLQSAVTPKPRARRTEDEEEEFWMDDPVPPYDDDEADSSATAVVLSSPAPVEASRRAEIYASQVELDIDSGILEQVIQWFLEVMPAEEHKTSYSPGDLYDLLSSSSETRFHAGYLFLRYLLHARSSATTSLASLSQSSEEQEALEAITWDVAVACLALSVKFHRDVLFPLDVIYADEFLDLAPHEMDFDDLEVAQRDVLEAIGYHVGSATPGAFMEELWAALSTLRLLVGFDGGWEAVQEEAWVILNDALQQPELLRYPPSLMTGAAVIEGILEILQRRYKTTGVDGRGKPVGKRDARSLRKVAMKCSRGIRLDIQDVLQIPKEDLLACQKWLGLTTE